MDAARRTLIEQLHAAPCAGVVAVTGGGSSAVHDLLAVPGASRTVLEALVPYHPHSLAEFLGHTPQQACSPATAVAMAERALTRARQLAPGADVFGAALTATLATDRPKRGDHRFHAAVGTGMTRETFSLTLSKGARDRAGEEAVCAAALLNLVAAVCGVAARLPLDLVADEVPETATLPDAGPLARLLRGEVRAACQEPGGRWHSDPPRGPLALLCGSFRPLHDGHLRLARAAAERTGHPAAFELSVTNVDKPPLSEPEARRRAGQFLNRSPVWLTDAPLFAQKAALFPGSVLVVGVDTAVRVVDPRYSGGDSDRRDESLRAVAAAGCRFLVAGRIDGAGRFVGLGEVAVPTAYTGLFEGLGESEFRADVSSTQIRREEHRWC